MGLRLVAGVDRMDLVGLSVSLMYLHVHQVAYT
jgi:hypothetical protein